MEKVLVVGSNGQLGSEIKALRPDWIFVDSNEMDICKPESWLNIKEMDFKAIINCAAYTAVDKAEDDSEKAFLINAEGVKNLAVFCESLNIALLQVSTDFVFDGRKSSPYLESDQVQPLSVYGESKLLGEEFALKYCSQAKVFRTSWLYNKTGGNFVNTMLRLGNERESLGVVSDQIGTPTFAKDLAVLLVDVAEDSIKVPAGVYHYSNDGIASWYDFALTALDLKNVDCQVNPIMASQYPTPAERPKYSVMSKEKLRAIIGAKYFRHWTLALKECLGV